MNRMTAKLVDHLTAKLVVANLVKLHLTKFTDINIWGKNGKFVLLNSSLKGLVSFNSIAVWHPPISSHLVVACSGN